MFCCIQSSQPCNTKLMTPCLLCVCVSSSAETRLDSEDGHSHSKSVNDSYMLGAKVVNKQLLH